MKNFFFFAAALGLAVPAFAQQEIGYVTANNSVVAETWGWVVDEETGSGSFSKDKTEHPGGSLLIETTNVTARTAFVDSDCASSISASGVTYFVVNGQEYRKVSALENPFQGAIGNTNPSGITLSNIIINKGWVIDYDVKKDGWMIAFGKCNLNKNFYVVEGDMQGSVEDGDLQVVPNGAVAYEFYGVNNGQAPAWDGNFVYKLPADADGYVDLAAADISKYANPDGPIFTPRIILDPENEGELLNNGEAGKWADCFGAMVFPVYAGCHYYVFGTGTKPALAPFVWMENYPEQYACVVETANEDGSVDSKVFNLIGTYETSAVNTVAVENDENAPVYNMLGIRVNADAKGLLIKNGKKFIRK